jgi:hypothetical protein
MRRVALVVPVLVLLAGCSSGGDSGTASAKAGGDSADSGAVAAQPAVQRNAPVALRRSVIRTADIDVRVPDVRRAVVAAERIATEAGGAVADEQLELRTDSPTGSLQLQVPPVRLAETLSRLSALGHEQSRRLGTDDVTEQVVDLESRLATQRKSVARVRALLDRASTLTDVVRLESELSKREADLESLQARQRTLAGSVAMATVKVQLEAEQKSDPVSAIGFSDGLNGGWTAFVGVARVTAATVGALLPFLPLLLVAAWVALRLRRRAAAT